MLIDNKFYTFKDSIDRIFIFKCELSLCKKIVYQSNGWCLINNKYYLNITKNAFIYNNNDLSPKEIDISEFYQYLPDNNIDKINYNRKNKIDKLIKKSFN